MRKTRFNLIWLSIFLIAGLSIASFFAYQHFLASMTQAQHELFTTNAEAKLKSITTRIETLSQQLNSYTEIPTFSEINYHTLTLNQAAINENIRSLELYFYSLHQRQPGYKAISFIGHKGHEKIRISDGAIRSDHRDFSQHPDLIKLSSVPRGSSFINLNSGNAQQSIDWWMPVFSSATKKIGFLVFEIDLSLLKQIIEISHWNNEKHIELIDGLDNLLLTELSKASSDGIHPDWIVTRKLPLPGLDWKIRITANQELLLKQVKRVSNIVTYIAAPLVILLLSALVFFALRHRKAEKNIRHMAFHDMLTGLVNRHEFEYRLDQALESAQKENITHSVLYMDLDHFKLVNDTAGHFAGDELLRQLSVQLKSHVRESDTLARLGGDEFALLLENCRLDRAETVANHISKTIGEFHFTWDGKTYDIGMSIGLVIFDDQTSDHDEILRHADIACFQAKESGRNRIQVYSSDDKAMAQRHGDMQWVSRIKNAVKQDSLTLDCHVIQSLKQDDIIHSWEILVRLEENGKIIAPGSFIPAAERFGLMPLIDRWVVEKSLFHLKNLYTQAPANKQFRFFINLSGASLSDSNFLSFLREQLNERKLPKGAICFEITETAAITNLTQVITFIEGIQQEGCYIALDDFGSGLSSFTYLKMIPVNFLKIDGSFIQNMLTDNMSHTIVDVINQIGHSANIQTIAEFVTDSAMKGELKNIGIDYAQGFGIEHPYPLMTMLKKELSSEVQLS